MKSYYISETLLLQQYFQEINDFKQVPEIIFVIFDCDYFENCN